MPKDPTDLLDTQLTIMFNEKQLLGIDAAAQARKMSRSAFIRWAALEAVKETQE